MNIQTSSAAHQVHAHFRPKPDGDKDPAGEAGWYMQREREMRGVSLEKAGQDTGIHPHHLEAIETGNLAGLPERGQALNMIGAYARYLGFDPQPLMAHFGRLIPKDPKNGISARAFSSAKIISFPLIERLKSMSSGAGGAVASVLAAVLLFGGAVYMLSPSNKDAGSGQIVVSASDVDKTAHDEAKGVRTVSSISKVSERELGDDSPAAGADGIAALIKRTIPGVAGEAAKKAMTPKAGAAKVMIAPHSAGVAPAGRVEDRVAVPQSAGDPAGDGFVLRATDDIWVRIEDREGNTLYSGMMKKGDTYTVPPQEGLTIIARDGGLLEWMLHGKVMGKLTKPGKVLVGEPLDPEKLKKQAG